MGAATPPIYSDIWMTCLRINTSIIPDQSFSFLIHDFPSSERRGNAALQEGSREHCTKLFDPLSFLKYIDDIVTKGVGSD
jgi:hypothetical protein